ncbi:MFS transporter [Alkalihalobacillus sp. 1P02AB]|uniref:MFS transporter n=1 Tax=Alkalihalobacillus sp. 1P02AB TaxID=3132260 RepID=UPI0039A72704
MVLQEKERNQKAVSRLIAYLFFAYSANTVIVSYLSVFYREEGLSGSEVGMLMAIGPFAMLLAQPVWGFLSDKYKTIRKILMIALIGLIVTASMYYMTSGFTQYLVVMFILFIFLSPVTALGDSLAQKTANYRSLNFGQIRMWGSIGFAFTSLVTGYLLTVIGVEHFVLPLVFMASLAFLCACFVSDVPGSNKAVTIVHAIQSGLNIRLGLFLFCILFISIPHRANDSYLGIYIVELGGPESMIGWAWFIGVVAEAFVFALSMRWFKDIEPMKLIIVAAFIFVIRWLLMSFFTNPWFVMPLQVLHGFSFGIVYITSLQYVSKMFPDHLQATGHVLFITTFFALSGIIGSLIGGAIIDLIGVSAMYFVMGISAFVGMVLFMVYYSVDKRKAATLKQMT